MTEKQGIITALQNEIAAAEKKRRLLATPRSLADWDLKVQRDKSLTGYIRGLQTAVRLLEQEKSQELT